MPKFKIFDVLSNVQILIFSFLKGHKVGTDMLGNVYYESRKPREGRNVPRRWVLYKGAADASSVPPEWHGWLHYQTDEFPTKRGKNPYRKSWQHPPQANQTGTPGAYYPPGHVYKGAARDKATGDYEAWSP